MSSLVSNLNRQIDAANETIFTKDKELIFLRDEMKKVQEHLTSTTSSVQLESDKRIDQLERQLDRLGKSKLILERKMDDSDYRSSKREKELLEGLRLAEDIHASMQRDFSNQMNEKNFEIKALENKNASSEDECRMLKSSLDVSERNEYALKLDKAALEKDLHGAVTKTQRLVAEYNNLSDDYAYQKTLLETKTNEAVVAEDKITSLRLEVTSLKDKITYNFKFFIYVIL